MTRERGSNAVNDAPSPEEMRLRAPIGGRFPTWLRDSRPILAALASAIAKVSVFNLPPGSRNAADWYGWHTTEALGAIVSSTAVLTLLFAPLLFLRARTGGLAAWTLNGLGSLLVWADIVHVRYFSDIAPLSAATVAWQVPLVWRSLLELVRWYDLIITIDVAFAAVLYARSLRRWSTVEDTTRQRRRRLGAILIASALLGVAVPIEIIRRDADEVFRWDFFRFFGVRRVGLPAYRAYEVSQFIGRRRTAERTDDPAQVARVSQFLDARAPDSTPPHELFGVARGANLIVIMIESLHAWPVSMVVKGTPVMPNLDAFSKRSISFDEFYGQTWYGKTTDAEFIALNALHPLADGSVQARYATNGFRALPEVLGERGYDTFSAHPFYASMYRRAEMHPRWGFARSYFGEAYKTKTPIGMGMGDVEFFAQTVPRLTAARRPFMSLLITLSSHYPFTMPERHQALALGEFQQTMAGQYLQSVHYADSALGTLLGDLERTGLLETSVVAIFGDHRERALQSDTLTRMLDAFGGRRPTATGFDLQRWREGHRLPFLIHLPRNHGAGRRVGSGGQIDVAPTLLGLLGIDDRELMSLGRDLLREPSGLVVMRDASFVLGDTACVAPGENGPRRRCGLLSTGAPLDTARFTATLAEARARLDMSDLIMRGDLVDKLAEARRTGRQPP